MRRFLSVVTPLAAALVLTGSAGAQTLDQVIRAARAAAVRNAQNVQNYTLVQDVGGMESTEYCVKQMVEGFPHFSCRRIAPTRADTGNNETARRAAALIGSEEFLRRARLEGAETVEGRRAHKIVIDNLAGIPAFDSLSRADVKMKSFTMFLDAERYNPVKTQVQLEVSMGGAPRSLTAIAVMQDYREVASGFMYAHKISTQVEGLNNVLTPEQQKMLAGMQEQLAKLPPEQRKMPEQMMQGRMGGMAGGGAMGTVITAKSIRINTGPPR